MLYNCNTKCNFRCKITIYVLSNNNHNLIFRKSIKKLVLANPNVEIKMFLKYSSHPSKFYNSFFSWRAIQIWSFLNISKNYNG